MRASAFLCALVPLAACASYGVSEISPGKLGGKCYGNQSCDAPYVCTQETCKQPGISFNGTPDAELPDSGLSDVNAVAETGTPKELRNCSEATTTGVYTLTPAPGEAILTTCNVDFSDGPWALVYRSTGAAGSSPVTFWNIPYAARLRVKGLPAEPHFYQPLTYLYGKQYMDRTTDVKMKSATMATVSVAGFDPTMMRFVNAVRTSGNADVFATHFAGWSSSDRDGDGYDLGNCATRYAPVTQHYGACFVYNLATNDGLANTPASSTTWGPYVSRSLLTAVGLTADAQDAGPFSTVSEITRWAKW
jgi:hypothetical protein